MSDETTDLHGYEEIIYAAIRERGVVIGKFDLLSRVLQLPSPRWGHDCIKRLEQRGLIRIERRPPPAPLTIRSVQS